MSKETAPRTPAREIRFRLHHNNGKIDGYEVLENANWKWMCLELNPDPDEKGKPRERWTRGVYPHLDRGFIRCQGTGLRDENNVEIFDGDVIEANDGYYKTRYNYRVFWNHSYCSFHAERIEMIKGSEEELFRFLSRDAVVIGNIYSNPELINTKSHD